MDKQNPKTACFYYSFSSAHIEIKGGYQNVHS